jgi:hypothetical protein
MFFMKIRHPTNMKWILMNRLWAKALGEKASTNHKEADQVALIRTILITINILTNLVIVAGVARHWN